MSQIDADLADLADVQLTGQEWTALAKLADALRDFDPLNKRPGVDPKTVERLIGLGFIEKAPSTPAFQARGMRAGYRLTDVGRRALDAQRHLRTGRWSSLWLGGGR